MHVELVVPALFPTREALQNAFDESRLPTLELLVARGRVTHEPRERFETWLVQAFGLDDVTDLALPAGALTVLADGGDSAVGTARWTRADPVHLHLAREHLTLVPGAALSLTRAEVDALCETLNQHFAGRLTLTPSAVRPECWCARLEDTELPFNVPLLEATADDVDTHLRAPANAADPANVANAAKAARAHALLNELQMLLHEHPVNAAREARGEPAVNSVWFWGAGPVPSTAQGAWHSVSADEPLVLGLARIAGIRHRALETSADSWLARAAEDGHHLIVLDGLRLPHALVDVDAFLAGLQALEARWFAPLLEALRVRRIGMLTLQAPDAPEALSIEIVRGDLRRFWRRPRALAPWKD
jgi:hypothetical protein